MWKITCLLLILAMYTFSGCSNRTDTATTQSDTFLPTPIISSQVTFTPTPTISNQDSITPTPIIGNQDNVLDSNAQEEYYYFDASKEWDESDYENKYGQKLNYFNAPIQSPYKYTYQCGTEDMTIDEVAVALGSIMMNDFMRNYEGKTFTVTEFQNLVSNVMDEAEFAEWQERFSASGNNVILKENQWLCTFDCEYKYTGVYGNIGEMLSDWEWMKGFATDGSGEDYVFIIQKVNDDEYILRGLPKTIMEIKK